MIGLSPIVNMEMGQTRQFPEAPSSSAIAVEGSILTPNEKIDNWAFFLSFSFFRLAAIAQGGAMVQPLAEFALAIIKEG